jgi:hypothetical protein
MGLAYLANSFKDLFLQDSQTVCLSWLQKLPDTARYKAIGVDSVLFQIKVGILLIQVTLTVSIDAMPKD